MSRMGSHFAWEAARNIEDVVDGAPEPMTATPTLNITMDSHVWFAEAAAAYDKANRRWGELAGQLHGQLAVVVDLRERLKSREWAAWTLEEEHNNGLTTEKRPVVSASNETLRKAQHRAFLDADPVYQELRFRLAYEEQELDRLQCDTEFVAHERTLARLRCEAWTAYQWRLAGRAREVNS